MRLGFTLVELIIVVIIIGILATFAMPAFRVTKERALDKEAIANLKLIQAAEKIYRMETGSYINCANTSAVNTNLKLSLPTGTNRNWDYVTNSEGTANATRYPSGRTWILGISEEEPTCSGTGCP